MNLLNSRINCVFQSEFMYSNHIDHVKKSYASIGFLETEVYVCIYLFKEQVGLPIKREIWAMIYRFWRKVVQRRAGFRLYFSLFSVFPTGSSSLRMSTLRIWFGALVFSYALYMLLTQRFDFTLEHQQPHGSTCVLLCYARLLLITVSVLPLHA